MEFDTRDPPSLPNGISNLPNALKMAAVCAVNNVRLSILNGWAWLTAVLG